MRRRRYLIGTGYLLWKTDEGGTRCRGCDRNVKRAVPSPGRPGIGQWKLGACKLTRASEAGGVGGAHICNSRTFARCYHAWPRSRQWIPSLRHNKRQTATYENCITGVKCRTSWQINPTRHSATGKAKQLPHRWIANRSWAADCLWWWTGAWRILRLWESSCLAHKAGLLLQNTAVGDFFWSCVSRVGWDEIKHWFKIACLS